MPHARRRIITNRRIFLHIGLLWLVFLLGGCEVPPNHPQAVDGVLDLRGWDLVQNGPAPLTGEWTFYWGEMLNAEDLNDPSHAAGRTIQWVPGVWNNQSIGGVRAGAYGYATYALRVLLDPSADIPPYLAIRVPPRINTAHALYVNGEQIGSNGQVGIDAASTTPQYRSYTAVFSPTTHELTIVLQIANFVHLYGGQSSALTLGEYSQVEAQQRTDAGLNFFMLGCIFIIGVYHLSFFSLRRREKGPLYFGLFCLITGIAVASFRFPEAFAQYISASWLVYMRFNVVLMIVGMAAVLGFIYELFPREVHKVILTFVAFATPLTALAFMLVPLQIVIAPMFVVVVYFLPLLGYTLINVTQAAIRRRSGAKLLLFALLFLLATVINDGLLYSERIETLALTRVSILFLIFVQARLLSVRFAEAFAKTETLTEEIQQSEEKYRTIFEESSELIVTTDRAGRIDAVNRAGLALLDYTEEDLRNFPLPDLFAQPETGERLLSELQETNEIREMAVDLRHRDGHSVSCSLSISRRRMDNGELSGFLALIHDMSAYRQAEAERERSLRLQTEKEKAEAASKAKSDFLATMSHELRTPLNSILGYAQILQDQTRLTTFQGRSVRTILGNGRHLLRLIQDILDLSRMEADRLQIVYTEVEIYPLLTEVMGTVQLRAEEKKLGLSLHIGPDLPSHIRTDEKRLRQILLNLLSNAIHYTVQGEVVLSATRLAIGNKAATGIRFAVTDTGIGLAEEQLAQIFEPFEQVEQAGGENPGLGLGLSISQRLARLLGSDIQVESTLGRGSRFWLDLPCTGIEETLLATETIDLTRPRSPLTQESDTICPPSAVLNQLYQLAQLGDMIGIDSTVHELSEANPAYLPFAEHVTGLARAFDDRAICAFIDTLRQTNDAST